MEQKGQNPEAGKKKGLTAQPGFCDNTGKLGRIAGRTLSEKM